MGWARTRGTVEFFRATVKLYADAIRDALQGLKRHPLKPLAGLLFVVATGFVEQSLSGLRGFAGGIVRGLLLTLLMALLLGFITLLLDEKRFSWSELWAKGTGIFGPLMNSLFLLFLVQFLLLPILGKPGNQVLVGLFNIVLLILFNPLPELVARRGVGGVDAFREALEFMRENGPEWLGAILQLLGPLVLLLSPVTVLFFLASADPLSGIFVVLKTALAAFFSAGGNTLFRAIFFVLGLYYVFFLFLVRMALFEALSTSTRRKRAYALRNK